MPLDLADINWLRSYDGKNHAEFSRRLATILTNVVNGANTMEQQGNFNMTGNPQAPAKVDALSVKGQNGHYTVSIHDNNPNFRGIQYYLEHSSDPNFSNPQKIHIGDPRDHQVFLGKGTRYYRAYSAYPSGPSSPAVYHGTEAQPLGVDAGGDIGAPAELPVQGSGTGPGGPDGGGSGPGPVPFRSTTGKPPLR